VQTAVAPTGRGEGDSAHRPMWRTVLSGLGQALITVGLVILLFVGYELWWTGLTTRHYQHQLLGTLERQWAHGTTIKDPPVGTALAVLRIPRLGRSYKFAVVQGTSTADLIKGPGHYVGTAMPGQVGNFYVAGHRTTYLHPFYNVNQLKPGDPIVLETRTMWFTYTVENIQHTHAKYQEIVDPTDFQVTYPVPDQPNPNLKPTQRVLTFTSCNPRYSASQRIVIHALLTEHQRKSAGMPPALAGYRLATP
jgi:sortase A